MSRRKLDIVIAHYNEPWSIVEPGITMLSKQACLDPNLVRATLIHDGTECLKELKDISFPFEFREVSIPHGGISAVRNHGIDISDAEWITFCDCDDWYVSSYSLYRFLSGLDGNRFDVLWNNFFIEDDTKKEDKLSIKQGFNLVWIHSKFFRLDFLKEHKVRFNEKLTISEDGAFCMHAYLETQEGRIGELKSPEPLYAWRRRDNSTTTNKKNLMKITKGVLERDIYVSHLFEERHRSTTGLMMARTITDAYATLTAERVAPYPEEIKDIAKMIRDFWDSNKNTLNWVTKNQWNYVLEASENECRVNNVLNPNRPSLDDWLKETLKVERRII